MDTVTTSPCSERPESHPALVHADPEGCGPGAPGHRSLSREMQTVVSPSPSPTVPCLNGPPAGPASPLLAPVAQPLEYLQLSHRDLALSAFRVLGLPSLKSRDV